MRVHFTPIGWAEYLSWKQTDAEVSARIDLLINEIRRTPFIGSGKPEPLRGSWSGWWSRRITREHRLVYAIEGKDEERRVVVAKWAAAAGVLWR